MRFHLYLITLLATQIAFCQTDSNDSKSKISSTLEDYFDLEREAIHLHTNKTTFVTNESIWYQGYIVERKTNKPFFTSNVFVVLYDEKGQKISDKLIYANDGTFSGKFDLSKNIHSGIYYLQVYTNWMNNFSENESTLQKITVINPLEGAKNYKKINLKTLDVSLNPEGGNLILGISNSLGIQIKDCRGNVPENCEANLENAKGEIINTVKLNSFGYGKLEFTPTGENYKVTVNYENEKITKQLPVAKAIGFAIQVNNFGMPGKTLINIKTNRETIKTLAAKKLYLVIHQDQKHGINDITLNEQSTEQNFTIPASELSSGVNTIRIIDSDLKEYAWRLIYIYPKVEKSITLLKEKIQGNQIQLNGQSKYSNATFSSALLPEQSKAWDDSNNIFTGITINPYLIENLSHGNYYFNNPNRMLQYELDLALLNQSKIKYSWDAMTATKPEIKYSFDMGLDIKGKIDPAIKNKTYHKTKFIAPKNLLWLNSDINEKGEYSFDHVLLSDSTYVEMALLKLPNFEEVKSKLNPQVMNRKRPFYKAFNVSIPEHCDDNLEMIDLDYLGFIDKKAIKLEEVKVENKKPRLRYSNQFGNANLRGYKITENQNTQSLLQFIKFNSSFDVNESPGASSIHARGPMTLNGAQSSPAIFIDGRQVMDIIEIETMQMVEVDEIFMNPQAIFPSVKNLQGIIKIYTKKLYQPQNNKGPAKGFYIAEGFSKYENFRNASYDFLGTNGFNDIALLSWSQRMLTDEKGTFSISLPDYNIKKGKAIIEGMTSDGILFQEEAIIDLK